MTDSKATAMQYTRLGNTGLRVSSEYSDGVEQLLTFDILAGLTYLPWVYVFW
jgi:hypothetical protein